MSAGKKEGGKNRKFGRHARNPSSVNQARRTERNKAKRAQKIVHNPPKHNDPKRTKDGRHLWTFVQWRGTRVRVECL